MGLVEKSVVVAARCERTPNRRSVAFTLLQRDTSRILKNSVPFTLADGGDLKVGLLKY